MISLKFTRDAERDIVSIHDYTVEAFGEARWHAYEVAMRSAFASLASNPLMGADRSSIRPKTRRLIFESHAVYYEIDGSEIVVLRVLGLRQDPGRHL